MSVAREGGGSIIIIYDTTGILTMYINPILPSPVRMLAAFQRPCRLYNTIPSPTESKFFPIKRTETDDVNVGTVSIFYWRPLAPWHLGAAPCFSETNVLAPVFDRLSHLPPLLLTSPLLPSL